MDGLRLALVFIPGIILLAMSLVVCVKYTRVYILDKRLATAQGRKSKWQGLLPIHVGVISLSYMGLVVMLMTSVAERFREPLYSLPRTIIYSVFLWLGVAALYIMVANQRRRRVQIESVTHIEGGGTGKGSPTVGDAEVP
jgi:hypothetical protein